MKGLRKSMKGWGKAAAFLVAILMLSGCHAPHEYGPYYGYGSPYYDPWYSRHYYYDPYSLSLLSVSRRTSRNHLARRTEQASFYYTTAFAVAGATKALKRARRIFFDRDPSTFSFRAVCRWSVLMIIVLAKATSARKPRNRGGYEEEHS
jgi:hypothetical protein